jgi:hypothetical protein
MAGMHVNQQLLNIVELSMFLMHYKKKNMSTDREKGRGNKRARVTRGSRNPRCGKRKHYIVHKPSRLN